MQSTLAPIRAQKIKTILWEDLPKHEQVSPPTKKDLILFALTKKYERDMLKAIKKVERLA